MARKTSTLWHIVIFFATILGVMLVDGLIDLARGDDRPFSSGSSIASSASGLVAAMAAGVLTTVLTSLAGKRPALRRWVADPRRTHIVLGLGWIAYEGCLHRDAMPPLAALGIGVVVAIVGLLIARGLG